MVVGSRRAAPLTAVAASTLGVTGVVESLMDDAVLDGDEMAVVGIHILLGGPTELTMIDDIVLAVLRTEGVLGDDIAVHVVATDTEADIADDEVA